jgi:hypothetical protein
MAMNVIGSTAASGPQPLIRRSLIEAVPDRVVEDTPDERLARTVICNICNAPKCAGCRRIYWHGMEPTTIARKFHSRRLADAKRVQKVRERTDAAER